MAGGAHTAQPFLPAAPSLHLEGSTWACSPGTGEELEEVRGGPRTTGPSEQPATSNHHARSLRLWGTEGTWSRNTGHTDDKAPAQSRGGGGAGGLLTLS